MLSIVLGTADTEIHIKHEVKFAPERTYSSLWKQRDRFYLFEPFPPPLIMWSEVDCKWAEALFFKGRINRHECGKNSLNMQKQHKI